MKTPTSIDPQRFRSQATGGGATRAEAEHEGNERQWRVWQCATDAARRLMGKDKSRTDFANPLPGPAPGFADSSTY